MNRLIKSLRKRYFSIIQPASLAVSGVKLHCDKESIPVDVRIALYRDSYEDRERKILLGMLRPGMRVVEIGAGIGFIGLLAARIVGSDNVTCYEANPNLESIIRNNHDLNAMWPKLIMRAVTTDGAPVAFFRNDNIISSSIYDRERANAHITVESIAFSDVLGEARPDVVIMDVEGAEVDLLGQVIASDVSHLVVELHPHVVGQAKIDELLSGLTKQGFELVERIRKTVYLRRTG